MSTSERPKNIPTARLIRESVDKYDIPEEIKNWGGGELPQGFIELCRKKHIRRAGFDFRRLRNFLENPSV